MAYIQVEKNGKIKERSIFSTIKEAWEYHKCNKTLSMKWFGDSHIEIQLWVPNYKTNISEVLELVFRKIEG